MHKALIATPIAIALGLVFAFDDARAFDRTAGSAPDPVAAAALGSPSASPAAAGDLAICPIDCDSCDGGVCRIDCSAGSDCASETVECPPGMDCKVSCDGDTACASATILGPSGFSLDVECSGRASCGGVVVDAGLDLDLACGGAEACSSAILHCGAGECDWACTSAGVCDGIDIK